MADWESRSRNSRFSSTLELRRVGELLRFAVPLSAMSVVFTSMGATIGWTVLSGLGAIPLYVVVLFLPRAPSLVAAIVYGATLLTPAVSRAHAIRVMICAGALAMGHARLQRIPPILLFLAGWLLFFGLGLLPFFESIQHLDPGTTLTLFFVEALSVIAISFLRMSKRFAPIVGAKARPVTLLAFLMHLLTLASLAAMLLALETLHYTHGPEILSIFQRAISRPVTLLSVLAGLFLLPLACSMILTKAARTALEYLQLTVSAESRLILSLQDPIPVAEIQDTFRLIRDRFSTLGTELRQTQTSARDLQKDALTKEEELLERELGAANLERLMDLAPWGMVSLSGNGLVISANDEFCRIMGIQNRESVRGQHLSTVDIRHGWGKEIISLLMWALRDWKQMVRRDTVRHYSSARHNSYLEIFLKIALAATIDPETPVDALRTSDIAVSLYIREHPDLRNFQLRLLSPSMYEVLGTQVSEIGKALRAQFTAVVGHLSIATEIVNKLMSQPDAQLIDGRLVSSLREIEKISRQSSRDLQEFEDKVAQQKRHTGRFDLHAHIQMGLDYLYELLAQDDRLIVELHDDDTPRSGRQNVSVNITANEDEVSRFLSYFLYFVQQIMARASDINISTGYESISNEAAAMLTGSHPGNYARIILFHPGQSLTANMMTGKFHRIDALSQIGSQLEVALSLLQAQTAQLGGFLSAQSTPAKGTTITFYLPVEQHQPAESAIMAKSRRHFKRKSFNEEASLTQNVLIVGTESDTLAALGNMLQHLGYNTQVKDPREIADEPAQEITFSGSGFGFPTLDELASDARRKSGSSDLLAYDLLILNIEQGPLIALPLIHSMERRNAEAATLLVIDSAQEFEKMFSDWALLKKPFDLDSLAAAIKGALSRA